MEKNKTIKSFGQNMLSNAESTEDQKFGSFYLSRFLGFDINYTIDSCEVRFDVLPPMFNPQGSLHGGIIATAMDVSMGHLLNHTSGSGATLEMNIKYLLPIKEGTVICEGSFLKQGKTISFLQSKLHRADGKLAAYANATWIPLKK